MDLGGGVSTSCGGWAYSRRLRTTGICNGRPERRVTLGCSAVRTPKRLSVRRCVHGIRRGLQRPCIPSAATWLPRPRRSARFGLTCDMADGRARSERKRSSFNWSNSTPHASSAVRVCADGCPGSCSAPTVYADCMVRDVDRYY